MRYLLDTNTVIALVHRNDRIVMRRIAIYRADVAISAIVLHELYFGAFGSSRVTHNVAVIEGLGLPCLPFDEQDARAAGLVRASLRRAGTPIGPFDVLIAGQALARGLVAVTANVAEFARVDGLAIEDWSKA